VAGLADLKDEERHDLIGAIRSYFGGIARARRLAGVPEPSGEALASNAPPRRGPHRAARHRSIR